MPSSSAPRASGSETLRAGSAAVLRCCSSPHAEDAAHGGGHYGMEKRGSAQSDARAESSQRARIQGMDCERLIRGLTPSRPSVGQTDHPPVSDAPVCSGGRRGNSRHSEAADALDSLTPDPMEASPPGCWPTGQDAARAATAPAPPPAAPEPPQQPRPGTISATASLINALTARVSKGSSGHPNSQSERLFHTTGQKLQEGEPASPFFPAESTGRRRSSRNNKPYLTVTIPSTQLQKDIRHLGGEKIFDRYCWDEVLQEQGDGGKVVVCKRKDSPEGRRSYVMKMRSKEALREQYHEEEFRKSQVRMLNFPPHVGVMPLREVLEDDKFYYIVMDKADGGSLFYSLLTDFQDGALPHSAIKSLIRELLEAVSHVHKQGMLHRDIKPDNLVMQFHDDPGSPTGKVKKVVLIDFDHADPDWSPLSPRRGGTCYGTMRFNAPETFLGEYSAESDLYSVGTILYLLMTGKMPYNDEVFERQLETASPGSRGWMDEVYFLMKQEPVDWACSPWPQQPECRDLCSSLLAFQARNRPGSAEEALAHKWLDT